MASPFAFFRRNQKLLLVLLTVGAMLTFSCVGFAGFGVDQLSRLLGIGTSPYRNPVVVRTVWGNLTSAKVYGPGGLLAHRRLANRFVVAAQQAARFGTGFYGFGPDQPVDLAVGDVVRSFILRQKARALGMRMTNEAVNSFVRAITGDRLRRDQFIQVVHELGVAEDELYSALRDELTSYNMGRLMGFSWLPSAESLPTLSPAGLWDYYHKLKDRAEVELAAVPASAFIDKVPAPSEAELLAYFNRYRERFSDPTAPVPGFRQERRIQLEYLKADFDKATAAISVTDEEIGKFYEENKERYRLPAAQGEKEKPATKAAGSSPTAEDLAKKVIEAADQAQKAKEPTEPKGKEEPPSDRKEESPPGGAAQDEQKKQQKEEEKEKAAPGTPPSTDIPSKKDQGSKLNAPRSGGGPSEQRATASTGAALSRSESGVASEQERTARAAAGAGFPDDADKKDGQSPSAATESPQTKGADQAAEEEAGGDEEKTAGPKADQKKPSKAGPSEPRYRPLDEELSKQIHQEIQRRRAREHIERLLEDVEESVLDEYAREYADWESRQKEKSAASGVAPKRPDLKDVAARHGLEYGPAPRSSETEPPLLSFPEAEKLEGIGQAKESRGDTFNPLAAPFAVQAGQSRGLFRALEARELNGNTYLYWVIKELPEHVPASLDKVRQQVVEAWRLEGARPLARQHAEELARLAREKGGSLKEALADQKLPRASAALAVADAGPLSWLSAPPGSPGSTLRRPPALSDVSGVDRAGEEFMRAVFSLAEGEVGVAVNAPETVSYVVRVKVLQAAPRGDFLRDHLFGWPLEYRQLAEMSQEANLGRLLRTIEQEAGLKWEQLPERELE